MSSGVVKRDWAIYSIPKRGGGKESVPVQAYATRKIKPSLTASVSRVPTSPPQNNGDGLFLRDITPAP